MSLRISYTLYEDGWATGSVAGDDAEVEFGVTYLSDPLTEMARSARAVLNGAAESYFRFMQEPGEHRVVVTREGDGLRVEVYRFPDTFSDGRNGKLVLATSCTVREFARECINCLRRILDEHGEAECRRRWKNADFPADLYRELLQLRRKLPAR